MSSLVLNVLLFLLILAPVLYFVFRGGNKKAISQLQSVLTSDQLVLGNYVELTHQVLGLDSSGSFLYIYDIANQNHERVTLEEVDKIEVLKSTGQGVAHDSKVTFLQKIDIVIATKDKKRITWSVYDHEKHHAPGSDLLDTEEFIKKIKIK